MTITDITEFASGLEFPEGPISLPDGSLLVVEIAGKRLTRLWEDGRKEVVAQLGGGPNGAAMGPDGRCYVCNNGGLTFHAMHGALLPGFAPDDYVGGWIEAVDLETGAVDRLYEWCGKYQLRGPNDLVFDTHGGFYFTDSGKAFKGRRERDRGAVFYARPDGSHIEQCIFPMECPNGIGLSPDGTRLYVTESTTARLWAFAIERPGRIGKTEGSVPWEKGAVLNASERYSLFDSVAIEANGNICLAEVPHGVAVYAPDGALIERHPMPDLVPTNICFSVNDPTVAFVTLAGSGRVVRLQWPRHGLLPLQPACLTASHPPLKEDANA